MTSTEPTGDFLEDYTKEELIERYRILRADNMRLLDTLEHERGVVRAAAVIAARLEAGLIVDFDNLLDALEQAGYTQERCAEIWAESQP
jgi:hypothetical protein